MTNSNDSLNSEKVLNLVAEAQKGNREALSQLVVLVSPAVHGQAKRIVSKGIEHEDLCQEGMFAVLSAVSSYRFDAGASFGTYVNLCVRRRLLSVAEKSNSEIVADFDISDSEAAILADYSAEEKLIAADSLSELKEKINSLLSAKERSTLELFLSGYTYQEIAKKLATTPKAVESTLGRVRRKLNPLNK